MANATKQKTFKHKMSKQDKEDWDNLYQYVRHNVLNYDDNQALSTNMVLRLKGLLTNKFMENSNKEDTANYSYVVVLNTFKAYNSEIQRGFANNNFRDEWHRFNYALKIVESNLNDVYIRMKNVEKAKEVEKTDVSHTVEYVNTFKKNEKKTNNRLDELW